MRSIAGRVESIEAAAGGVLEPGDDRDYWLTGSTRRGLLFRVPVRPLKRLLRGHGSVVIIENPMVIRTGDGASCVWLLRWVWDPEAQAWVCHHAEVRDGAARADFWY